MNALKFDGNLEGQTYALTLQISRFIVRASNFLKIQLACENNLGS